MRKGEHFPFWTKTVRTKIKPGLGVPASPWTGVTRCCRLRPKTSWRASRRRRRQAFPCQNSGTYEINIRIFFLTFATSFFWKLKQGFCSAFTKKTQGEKTQGFSDPKLNVLVVSYNLSRKNSSFVTKTQDFCLKISRENLTFEAKTDCKKCILWVFF